MVVKALIDNGVAKEKILFMTCLAGRIGVKRLPSVFSETKVVAAGVVEDNERRWIEKDIPRMLSSGRMGQRLWTRLSSGSKAITIKARSTVCDLNDSDAQDLSGRDILFCRSIEFRCLLLVPDSPPADLESCLDLEPYSHYYLDPEYSLHQMLLHRKKVVLQIFFVRFPQISANHLSRRQSWPTPH